MSKKSTKNGLSKKRLIISIVIIALLIAISVTAFMIAKKDYVEIIVQDAQTGEQVEKFSAKHKDEFREVCFHLFDNWEACEEVPENEPEYVLYLKDPKDSYYDIFVNVIFDGEEIYLQHDFDKIENEDLSKMVKEYNKCTTITKTEFMELIGE